jgi:hypothetical protein
MECTNSQELKLRFLLFCTSGLKLQWIMCHVRLILVKWSLLKFSSSHSMSWYKHTFYIDFSFLPFCVVRNNWMTMLLHWTTFFSAFKLVTGLIRLVPCTTFFPHVVLSLKCVLIWLSWFYIAWGSDSWVHHFVQYLRWNLFCRFWTNIKCLMMLEQEKVLQILVACPRVWYWLVTLWVVLLLELLLSIPILGNQQFKLFLHFHPHISIVFPPLLFSLILIVFLLSA